MNPNRECDALSRYLVGRPCPADVAERYTRAIDELGLRLTFIERVIWNPALSVPAKKFEFTDHEVARIKAALQTWDSYGFAADRRWLEPILNEFFSPHVQTA